MKWIVIALVLVITSLLAYNFKEKRARNIPVNSSSMADLNKAKEQNMPVNNSKKDLKDALFSAVRGPLVLDRGYVGPGNVEEVKRLLQQGADVHAVDSKGSTLLMGANSDNLEMIQTLLAAGVDVNRQDQFGNTALMLHLKNPQAVALLLKAGAQVNTKDEQGQNALMRASQQGLEEAVALLLQAGADVHATDKQSQTALMFASRLSVARALPTRSFRVWAKGHERITQSLLAAGADVHARDKSGKTPLMHAVCWGDETVVSHTSTRIFGDFVPEEQIQVVNLLLKQGASPTQTDEKGKTALDYAYEVQQMLPEEEKTLHQMESKLIDLLKAKKS